MLLAYCITLTNSMPAFDHDIWLEVIQSAIRKPAVTRVRGGEIDDVSMAVERVGMPLVITNAKGDFRDGCRTSIWVWVKSRILII